LLLVLITTALSGCWSAREVEQLALVAAMGVDLEENGLKVTAQIIIASGGGGDPGGGGGSEAPVWITTAKGASLAEAIFNLSMNLSKRPFFSHTYVFVMGEAYAREGIDEVIDWLSRERQMRDRIRIAVAQGTAEDILMIEPKITELAGEYLEEVLRLGEDTGFVPPSQFLSVSIAYANQPRMQIWIPVLKPQAAEESGGSSGQESPSEGSDGKEDKKPNAVELAGSAVFRGDRMVGSLDIYETRGIAWLTGSVSDTLLAVNRVEGQVTQRVQYARVRYQKGQGEALSLRAHVAQDGKLQSWPLKEQGVTPTILAQLQNHLAEVMEREIRGALERLQKEFNADCAGLGEKLRRLDNRRFMQLDWEEAFPDLVLELEIEAFYRRIGLTK
jgi:spore germination protein KC